MDWIQRTMCNDDGGIDKQFVSNQSEAIHIQLIGFPGV